MTPQQETLIWLAISVAGALFTAGNLVDALRARAAAVEHEPTYVPIANSRVRLDAVRLVTCLAFVVGAMVVLGDGSRAVVILTLIVGNLGVLVNSALDRWDSHRTVRWKERRR